MIKKASTIALIIFTLFTLTLSNTTMLNTNNNQNDYKDITYTKYISSIGLEMIDNQIQLYSFYFNDTSLGKVEYATSSEDASTLLHSKGNSIKEAFFNINNTSNILLDYSHVDSIIFNVSFFNKDNIIEFIEFTKDNPKVYPSFNIYVTKESIKDILFIDNNIDTQSYYTLFTQSKSSSSYPRTTFLNMITNMYEKDYFTLYPLITKVPIKDDSTAFSLAYAGYAYFVNNSISYIYYEDNPLLYLVRPINDITIKLDNNIFNLVVDKIYKPFVKPYIIIYYIKSSSKTLLKDDIKQFIYQLYYEHHIDLFNTNYYNVDIDKIKFIFIEKIV